MLPSPRLLPLRVYPHYLFSTVIYARHHSMI
jgi:hypothetical protein